MSIPNFVLIAPPPRATVDTPTPPDTLCDAWLRAISSRLPEHLKPRFAVLEGTLSGLPVERLQCDCVVSPANSFGIMDGGYDLALSREFQGAEGLPTLKRQVQRALHAQTRGYLPPGSCVITSLPDDVLDNKFHASSIAVLPTMRYPVDVRWHQDLIYNATWNLLVEIERWNAEPEMGSGLNRKIERVLMTGLATGYGRVSSERCAQQMMLAVKHFAQGVPEYADWGEVDDMINDVNATVNL
ncbi:macro domain-like protein [Gloeopeniophorella convolvens]|nr:macro domain-like protein [Gloeopeniophorella convolvens]